MGKNDDPLVQRLMPFDGDTDSITIRFAPGHADAPARFEVATTDPERLARRLQRWTQKMDETPGRFRRVVRWATPQMVALEPPLDPER